MGCSVSTTSLPGSGSSLDKPVDKSSSNFDDTAINGGKVGDIVSPPGVVIDKADGGNGGDSTDAKPPSAVAAERRPRVQFADKPIKIPYSDPSTPAKQARVVARKKSNPDKPRSPLPVPAPVPEPPTTEKEDFTKSVNELDDQKQKLPQITPINQSIESAAATTPLKV